MIHFALATIILTVITVILFSIFKWNIGFSDFYCVSIIDIALFVVTIILGFCVTYYISVVVVKKQKKHDVILEALDVFHNSLITVMEKIYNSKDKVLTEDTRNWFLVTFTMIRNNYEIVVDLYAKGKIAMQDSFEMFFSDFQEKVVPEDFIPNHKKFDDNYIALCINSYAILKRAIFNCKLSLHDK